MAESVAADHPFVRKVLPPDEGRAFFAERGQPFKVEILDDLRIGRRAPRASPSRRFRRTSTARSSTCAAARMSSRRAHIGPFKLLAVSGAYWRGDQARPALQRIYGTVWSDAGRARSIPVAARGSQEARPPPAGRRARPVLLPRRRRRAPRSGTPRAGRCTTRCATRCARSRRGAATRRSTRRRWCTRSYGSSRATGTCTATTCSSSSRRSRRSA